MFDISSNSPINSDTPSPFEGYSGETAFDFDCEQLLHGARVHEARTSFLVMAANVYAEPTTVNKQAFDALASAWTGALRDYTQFVLDQGDNIKTEHSALDLLAIQYLHETEAINAQFAYLTGDTNSFYTEEVDIEEIVLRLQQPLEGVDDEDEAIFSQLMYTLDLDIGNFLAHVEAQPPVDVEDEGDNFFDADDLPTKVANQPESIRRRLAKQTLKVAGNVAAMTLAVYLGGKLKDKY